MIGAGFAVRGISMRMSKFGKGLFVRTIIGAFVFAPVVGCLPGRAETQAGPSTKYGAWEMQCALSQTSKTQLCALTQTVRSEEQASVNTVVAVRKAPTAPNAVLQIVASPSVFLLEGVKVKIDQDDIGTIPFFRCSQIGCAAEAPLPDEVLSKLQSGKNMLITIYINPGEGLRNILPLDGFKDGYRLLQ